MEIETAGGQRLRLTTLTRSEAEHTWRGAAWGAERVIVSTANLTFADDQVNVRALDTPEVRLSIWPLVDQPILAPGARCNQTAHSGRTVLDLSMPRREVTLLVEHVSARKYHVTFPAGLPADVNDVFLKVDYEGDTGMAFINVRLVADNFNHGPAWLIGLKRFRPALPEQGLTFVFSPWRQGQVRNTSSSLAGRSEFEGQERLAVHSITAIPEYGARLEVEGEVPNRSKVNREAVEQY